MAKKKKSAIGKHERNHQYAEKLRRLASLVEKDPSLVMGMHCVIFYQDNAIWQGKTYEKGLSTLQVAGYFHGEAVEITTKHPGEKGDLP